MSAHEPIYLDNNATTPLDPRALEAMMPYLTSRFGNAASQTHRYGQEARAAVETARRQLAGLIGARPDEIVFTSGATEAINLALTGLLDGRAGAHVVTVATEHKAVLDTCKALERRGTAVTVLPVQPDGLLDLDVLAAALRPETALVSVMMVNNEIGVLQPIAAIARLCRERGVAVHCDAAQAVGRVPVDVRELGVDLLSLSAHKFHGPKGTGALFVSGRPDGPRPAELIHGGGHENGMRSGTLDVPGIVGMGAAAALAARELPAEGPRLAALRDRLLEAVTAGLDGVTVNGSLVHRAPSNLSLSFDGVAGEELILALSGIALSSGSACNSDKVRASYVLLALGVPEDRAAATLRFGLGRFTTEDEIEQAAREVVETVRELRGENMSRTDAVGVPGRKDGR